MRRAVAGIIVAAALALAAPAFAKDVKLTPINFGAVPIGEQETRGFTATNRSDEPIPLLGQSLTSFGGIFRLEDNGCFRSVVGPTLDPGESCQIVVRFFAFDGLARGYYCLSAEKYCAVFRGVGR